MIKKFSALAAVMTCALAVTACAPEVADPQPQPEWTAGSVDETVDDCPRADGQPCR